MTEAAAPQLMKEESIRLKLIDRFPALKEKVRVTRARRIFASCEQTDFHTILSFVIDSLGFTVLCAITGLDNGTTLGFVYHLARKDGVTISIQYEAPKERPTILTVTQHFSYAEVYERELVDLLGAKVEGLGPGNRYPLPDDWPEGEYPLRKDWKQKASEVPPCVK